MYDIMTTCSFASFAGGGLACGGDIEDAVAAANDTPVQMIDTSIVRVDQHGVCSVDGAVSPCRNRLRSSRHRTSLFAPKIPAPATRRVSYACPLSLTSRRSPSSRRSWGASSSGLNSADCTRASAPDLVRTTCDSALRSNDRAKGETLRTVAAEQWR